MIDMRRQFLSVAALAFLLTGCSKTDGGLDNFPEDRVIRVATEVETMTKGSYTTGSLTDFDLAVAGMNSRYSYDNIQFTKNSDGAWTPESLMLWENSEAFVDIFALAPSNPSVKFRPGAQTPVNVSVQEVQTEADNTSDVLYWGKTGFQPKRDLVEGKIAIEFRHVMSKLKLTLRLGTEFNLGGVPNANPISELKISGTSLSAQCGWGDNYSYDELSLYPDSKSVKDMAPYLAAWRPGADEKTNCYAEYECILVPQTVGANTLAVSFKAGDKTSSWKLPSQLVFEKNTVYTLTLQVGKDFLIAGEISASPWDQTQGPEDMFTD